MATTHALPTRFHPNHFQTSRINALNIFHVGGQRRIRPENTFFFRATFPPNSHIWARLCVDTPVLLQTNAKRQPHMPSNHTLARTLTRAHSFPLYFNGPPFWPPKNPHLLNPASVCSPGALKRCTTMTQTCASSRRARRCHQTTHEE